MILQRNYQILAEFPDSQYSNYCIHDPSEFITWKLWLNITMFLYTYLISINNMSCDI